MMEAVVCSLHCMPSDHVHMLKSCRDSRTVVQRLHRLRGAANEAQQPQPFNDAVLELQAKLSDQSLYGAFWHEIAAERIQLISDTEAPGGVPEANAEILCQRLLETQQVGLASSR